jgi:poly [ADP-ribose] polymerase 2/3/4
MVAEVNIFQEYKSESTENVEATYLFPIDDNGNIPTLPSQEQNKLMISTAAICAFEAYINDKHVIGKVREKKAARKQYNEAVQKGHGAYLGSSLLYSPHILTRFYFC